jgi:VWFA-related protein
MGWWLEASGYCCVIRVARLLVVAAAVCAHTWASTGASNTTPQTLRVNTRLVVVNVVAHNRKGEPVEGLTQRDFTILDNGKPQQISVFSVESGQAEQKSAKPLPPNVFSNRGPHEGNGPINVAVILLDGKDTSPADGIFARNELIKIIRQIPSDKRIAVYVLGRWGLSVIQDFTSDPSPLLEAIRGYHGDAGEEPPTPGPEAGPGQAPTIVNDAAARIRADVIEHTPPDLAGYETLDTFKLIEAIAGHLSGLPGRKSLIWVTDRLPFPTPDRLFGLNYSGNTAGLWDKMRDAVRALNQADVAIYPVDAHGLVVGPPNVGLYRPGLPPPLWPGEVWTVDMDVWARYTGGRPYYYTNGLAHAIRRAMEDSKVAYTLGYYPSDIAWNGKYRHIRVRLDRKDVQLRYRRGYFATDTTANPASSPASMLETAAAGPLDSTGLGVTVRLTPIGNPPPRELKTVVYVDGRGLTFLPENGYHDASVVIWAGQYSKQGVLLEQKTRKLSFRLSENDYRSALAGGLGLTLQETANPRASELRVAVLDTASGTTGSIRVPLGSGPKTRGRHPG